MSNEPKIDNRDSVAAEVANVLTERTLEGPNHMDKFDLWCLKKWQSIQSEAVLLLGHKDATEMAQLKAEVIRDYAVAEIVKLQRQY